MMNILQRHEMRIKEMNSKSNALMPVHRGSHVMARLRPAARLATASALVAISSICLSACSSSNIITMLPAKTGVCYSLNIETYVNDGTAKVSPGPNCGIKVGQTTTIGYLPGTRVTISVEPTTTEQVQLTEGACADNKQKPFEIMAGTYTICSDRTFPFPYKLEITMNGNVVESINPSVTPPPVANPYHDINPIEAVISVLGAIAVIGYVVRKLDRRRIAK